MGYHVLLQGIFLTQKTEPTFPAWQVDSLPLKLQKYQYNSIISSPFTELYNHHQNSISEHFLKISIDIIFSDFLHKGSEITGLAGRERMREVQDALPGTYALLCGKCLFHSVAL